MDGANSLLNMFLVFLAVAGGLVLVNALIDLGIGSLWSSIDLARQRLSRRWNVRQKAKAVSLPPR